MPVGGRGRDDLIFGAKDGFDTITDFCVRQDDLVFSAFSGTFRNLSLKQRGDDLPVQADRVKVLLEDVSETAFDEGDVILG
ncbi:MAG: hypothetical protein AAFU61_06365 [Pseudomonadota bacterium]